MIRQLKRNSSLALACLCSLSLLTTGCASLGGGSGDSATLSADDAAFSELGFRREWSGFPTMSRNGSIREVYIDRGNVIVQETGSTVSFLEPTTGRLRWHNRLGTAMTKFVSLYPYNWRGAPSVLASSESDVHVLQADTGNLLARQNLSKVVSTGPVIIGDIAVYGTAGGELMGHSFVSGARLWGHDLNGPIQAGPTYVHGAVVGVADSGQIVSLEATSGALFGRGEIFSGASTAPVAGDMLFYVASLDQSIWAFDPGNPGREIWRVQTSAPLRSQPVAYGGALLVSTTDSGLLSLDQRTGNIQWANGEVHGEVVGIHEGRLVVFDPETREAYTLSPTSGVVYQQQSLPTVAGMAFDRFADGDLYAWGEGGVVAKFSTRF